MTRTDKYITYSRGSIIRLICMNMFYFYFLLRDVYYFGWPSVIGIFDRNKRLKVSPHRSAMKITLKSTTWYLFFPNQNWGTIQKAILQKYKHENGHLHLPCLAWSSGWKPSQISQRYRKRKKKMRCHGHHHHNDKSFHALR